jgi:hypothetical protein
MNIRSFIAAFCLLLTLSLTASVLAQDALPGWSDLPAGEWTQISPGGDTICSNGTPYSFFARPADEPSDDLLVHFQGGGACWTGNNCDLFSSPTYDPFVDESDNPAASPVGIFDFENEENPFTDYNMVMVPYCTGDVHIGNTTTTYPVGESGETIIQHRGYTNATAVLDWTFENVQNPDTVFVTGCSAGSIPSPFYTQFVAEAYPNARIEQLGDASGGYRNQRLASTVFDVWGTMDILPENYADMTLDTMNFEQFYTHSATMFPDITFTQYNSAGDNVQETFLLLGGLIYFDLKQKLMANFADIEAGASDNFFSFTTGGNDHCVTVTPQFYRYGANGQRFVDWVAAVAAGEDVETVTCEDCAEVELIDGA